MAQVSSELLELHGYADWKKACEILIIGKDKKKLAKLRNELGFSDFIVRGQKIGYKIKSLQEVRQKMDKGLIKL